MDEPKTTMTIQEVADALGASYATVRRSIVRTMPGKLKHGVETRLDEKDVAVISHELKNNDRVNDHVTLTVSATVQNTTTELEILANYKAATEAYTNMLQQKNQALEYKVAELTPKAEVYDLCCSSENLHSIQDLGKNTGLGAHNIFKRLMVDGIIYEAWQDGQKYYKPYADYDRYFMLTSYPMQKMGRNYTAHTLKLTSKGFLHFSKRYGVEK